MATKWTSGTIATATSVAAEDLLMTVDDPSGTPTSKKITVGNFIASDEVLEVIRDHFGDTFVIGGDGITVTHSDVGNTFTIDADGITLGGSYDYVTLSGQALTVGQVDLATDVTGTLPSGNIGSHTHVIADVTDFTDNSTNWDTAYGWGDHGTEGYLTSYTETDPIFVASDVYSVTTADIATWDTAYGWGNHASGGYLTSYTESDPIFVASDVYGVTTADISTWTTAYGWGNHASAGYLTSYTETDPVFVASDVYGVTTADITNWDTAYGWGDHSTEGYITSIDAETDPVFVASDVYGVTTADIGTWDTAYGWGDHSTENYAVTTGDTFTGDMLFNGGFTVTSSGSEALSITRSGSSDLTLSSSGSGDLVIAHSGSGTLLIGGIDFETQAPLWNTAYGWGDHGTEGYLTSYTETDPVFVASDVYGVTTADIATWDTAYGWGDHASGGYSTTTGTVTSVATAGSVDGLTLTGGTITTSGTITLGGTISITESQISDIGGHTHTSSSITDFDTEVSNNSSVALNTAKITYPSSASSKLAGIEALADVTDATNVSAAGALMISGGAMTGELGIADNLLTRPKIKDYSVVLNDIGSIDGSVDGWDLDVASYDSKSFTWPSGSGVIWWMADGSKVFVALNSQKIARYSVSTPWDISTASSDSNEKSFSAQVGAVQSFVFNTSGTKLVIFYDSDLYGYTLSTAWDMTSATYDSETIDLTELSNMLYAYMNEDGTRLFAVGDAGATQKVYSYTLSTAWDVTTASYDSKSLDVSGKETDPQGMAVNSDGTILFLVGYASDKIHKYVMSTAWDLTTATHDSEFSVASENTYPQSLTVGNNGEKTYMGSWNGVKTWQYTTGAISATQDISLESGNYVSATITVPTTLTFSDPPASDSAGSFVLELTDGDAYAITWPASLDWAGGSAPTLTSSGVDILAFVTRDGGTIWHGYVMSTDSK
jgi:hypothetical protein